MSFGFGLRWVEESTSSIVFAMWRQYPHMGGHIGATWRIRLNCPSAAVKLPLYQITSTTCYYFMVALWNRANHIYFHAVFCSSFFFFFFPRLISAAADCMSAILHTWCGLNANLRCRSETCCTWLSENTGLKKVTKNRHLGTIAQLCRAISSQLRHVPTIGKKLVKQQYVLHMSPQ